MLLSVFQQHSQRQARRDFKKIVAFEWNNFTIQNDMKNHHPRSKRFDVMKTNDLFVVFVIITKWHEKNVVATEKEPKRTAEQ